MENIIEYCKEISALYPSTGISEGDCEVLTKDFTGGRLDSYLTDMYFVSEGFPVAMLQRAKKTWMSITPMEVESHLTHIEHATGDVFVGGLGMGFYITQIVKKSDVKSVVVVEQDTNVIRMYNKLIENDPVTFSNNKLKIVHGDLFAFIKKDKKKYDYAYLDIWLSMDFDEYLRDFSKIKKGGLKATKVGFWGMERLVRDIIASNQWLCSTSELHDMMVEELAKYHPSCVWAKVPSIELLMKLTHDEEDDEDYTDE